MKKRTKKLVLHRETLVALEQVQGGATAVCYTLTCYTSPCEYSRIAQTCLTCVATCTTNYC